MRVVIRETAVRKLALAGELAPNTITALVILDSGVSRKANKVCV